MKIRKNQKMKNAKSSKIPGFGLTRENPRQFPGFVVLVVTFFDEIINVFHVSVFPRKNDHHQVGREEETYIVLVKMDRNR